MKSLHKYRTLMGFIYAIVMLLPFSSILLRCLYVTFNKNAYLSYADFNSETSEYRQITNYDSLIVGNTYKLISNNTENTNLKTSTTGSMLVENVQIETSSRTLTAEQITGISSIMVYKYNNNTLIRLNNLDNPIPDYGLNSHYLTCTFTYLGLTGVDTTNSFEYYFDGLFYENTLINNRNTLDNAFDYSLDTFLEENGTGRLNLTNWFTSTFLDETSHNMLYINYINWYMNYSLLVSCVYLLYSVLMWFLTFARYLINKPLKEME